MDIDTTCTPSKMISIYKPMIKSKMEKNIDIRAETTINLINTCIQTIINDTKENNIMKLIESHNPSLNIPPFDLSQLKQSSKQKLYTKVNEWKGLGNFKRKSNDIKSYKKNANGWWNRKKPDLLGEHFFHPLLHNILPLYIKKYIIGVNNISTSRYCTSNPLYLASYDLVYFSIIYEIFHEEIAFARTKFLPLILDQCFIQSKCRHTLQQLLITLGDRHDIPWNNKGVTKGDNARNYARKWVSKILTKIRVSYQQVTQPLLEAYGEIHMPISNMNDNDDMHTPSISYSMSSEPVLPTPFSLNTCTPLEKQYYNRQTNINQSQQIQFKQRHIPHNIPPIIINNPPVNNNNNVYYNDYNISNSNILSYNNNTSNNNMSYNNNNNNNNNNGPLPLPPLIFNNNYNDTNNGNKHINTYTRKQFRPYRKIHNISTGTCTPSTFTSQVPNTPSISSEAYCDTLIPSGFSSCSNDLSFPTSINDTNNILLPDMDDMDSQMFDNEPIHALYPFNHDDDSFHFI
eukprot:534623_1